MAIPLVTEYPFEYGIVETLAPGIRRVVARNPSPFTFHGTGTYIVGEGAVAVIDPGPDDPAHIEAVLAGLGHETVSHILVTHTHRDHSPGARLLTEATGAKSFGYGAHGGGAFGDENEVEEGADTDFVPDVTLRDGDSVSGPGWALEAVHTPGHCSNHLCFRRAGTGDLFTGDHVMGWSTTVVIPPDGDMGDYLESLRKVRDGGDSVLWPTHGPAVREPRPFVSACIAHREGRELQIYNCLDSGLETVADMVARMYVDVDKRLHPAAARSVLAHLVHMVESGRVLSDGAPGLDARFTPAASA